MSDLLSPIQQHVEIGQVTLVSIAGVLLWWAWKYYLSNWKAELAHPGSLEKLRPYLEDSSWRDTYRHTLARALDAADWFFGPPLSFRAFGVCLLIAGFYPTALFLVAWVVNGPHTFGGVELLPGGWPMWARGAFFGGLLLSGYGSFLLVKYHEEIDAWTDSLPAWIAPEWAAGWGVSILMLGGGLLFGSIAYTITGTGFDSFFGVGLIVPSIVAGGRSGTLSGAMMLPASFANSVGPIDSISHLFFGLVTGAIAIITGGFSGEYGTSGRKIAAAGPIFVFMGIIVAFVLYFFDVSGSLFQFYLSYVVFFCALPLLNAILDMASWAVSRWLGREMLSRKFHRWGTIGFALVDFVLAFVFLCVLAVLLGAGGEALNRFAVATTDGSIFDLDATIADVATAAWTDGLWVTLMLVSTLVPTAIHAFVVIGSVVQLRGRAEAREQWRREADAVLDGEKDELDPHTRRKIAEHWLWGSWLPSVVLLLVLLAVGWFAWQASVLPDALLAAVEWGRSLVG